ncbi:MAG: cytochrome c biogenesis protein CcsA [Bacteroidota bacterium]|nr:cytochrome c biogenesis protein CcsA [Bacteroidota bacterium]
MHYALRLRIFKTYWWKVLSGVLLIYAIVMGFSIPVPDTMIQETIRNLFFHVGMWFGMLAMLTTGFIYSLRFLRTFNLKEDRMAVEAVNTGILFGILGILTGMIWANFTWGAPWVNDPKLDGAAAGLLIYLAYMVLRSSVNDIKNRAKISAVYNIFAFVMWIVFVLVIPRVSGASIHPGNEDSPVLPMHLDPAMRWVFYPAMLGWILLGFWILNLRVRINKLNGEMTA